MTRTKWVKGACAAAFAAAAALLSGVELARSAGFFTNGLPVAGGAQYPSTLPLTGNETIPADTNLPSGANPQSEGITVASLAGGLAPQAAPRNLLSNGAMQIAQQGTGIQTCGTNTAPIATAFAADRWFCDVNVASGAGRSQVTTSTPAPPTGFVQSVRLYRTSGALLQPVCLMQAIESVTSTRLQGKNVVFSGQFQALAGFTATAGAVQVYVITGTGTDQGFGTLTASPAITPAWTGLAGGTTANATFNLNTASPLWQTFFSPPVTIPAAATEVGVEVCFTPVGSGSGTTDGFAMTGAQLEVVLPGANPGPSAFENRPAGDELAAAKRFFWQINEPASGAGVPITCQNVASGSQSCTLALPVPMRGTTPVVAIPSTGTFKQNIGGTPTTWTSPTAGTCSVNACTITSTTTDATVGNIGATTGGGGTGVVTVNNDVIM